MIFFRTFTLVPILTIISSIQHNDKHSTGKDKEEMQLGKCTVTNEEKESMCKAMLTTEIAIAQDHLEHLFPGIIKSTTAIMDGISEAA